MFKSRNILVILVTIAFFGGATAQKKVTKEESKIEPEFIEMTDFTVVGLLTLNSNKCNMIPKLWERFMPREKEIKNILKPNVGFGVTFGMQEEKEEKEEKGYTFFYLVGLPVKNADSIPEGMIFKNIPAHKYAKFTHKGPLSGLGETYDYIYMTWLPESKYECDGSACELEWYDERFKMDSEDSEFDIYVPIVEKSK